MFLGSDGMGCRSCVFFHPPDELEYVEHDHSRWTSTSICLQVFGIRTFILCALDHVPVRLVRIIIKRINGGSHFIFYLPAHSEYFGEYSFRTLEMFGIRPRGVILLEDGNPSCGNVSPSLPTGPVVHGNHKLIEWNLTNSRRYFNSIFYARVMVNSTILFSSRPVLTFEAPEITVLPLRSWMVYTS